MNLEPTGERMILDRYKASIQDFAIYLMHIATYAFAEQYTNGRRVLDFGCGSGYGSAQIATTASHVLGVDVAEDAVAYARSHFEAGNLQFDLIEPDTRLPFADGSFDTVLSFQVLEHVKDVDNYLGEIRRVLAPGGRLVLATPDRSTRLLPMQRPWNRWHLHEYSRGELKRLVSRHFQQVTVMGMTATRELLQVELDRCRRMKWLSLPFTLPILPDRWRIAALNLIHRLRGPGIADGPQQTYPYGVSDIGISEDAHPSVNLIVVASLP